MAHELHTNTSLTYKFFPLKHGSLKFRVKAKSDAHISLTSGPSEDQPIYEIFIGGWGNTKSALRRNSTKPDKAMADTPDILSAENMQEFWIKWSEGSIMVWRVGDSTPFLMYWDPDPFPIGYYGLRTGCGSTGEWLIEGARSISTPNKLVYQFWPIPADALTIDVRCPSNAHIALISSRHPEKYEEFPRIEILIGAYDNTLSLIRRDGVTLPRVTAATPNIVTENEFRRFKIRWKNGSLLVLPEDEESEPIIEYHDPDHVGITYYGVRTSYGASGDWKIKEGCKEVGPGKISFGWKGASNREIPPEAFIGGNDFEAVQFVGRAFYKGALLPGRINPISKLCYISFEGNLESSNEYQVLCGNDFEWVPTSDSHIPCNSVIGGYSEDETLYIGRVHHEGTTTLGKVHGSQGLCYICYSEEELTFENYEILVSKFH